jgi:hypothetical protein
MPAGRHVIPWNGKTDRGDRALSGVYVCRLRAGGHQATRKFVLLAD